MGSFAAGAEQPQPAVLTEFQDILTGIVDEIVLAVAEEGEVPLVQPPKQILGLPQLCNLGRMGNLVEPLGYLPGLVPHLRPVFDGGADVPKHPFQSFGQALPSFHAGAANLHCDPGFHVRSIVTLGNQAGQTGQCSGVTAGNTNIGRNPVHFDQLIGLTVARDHEHGVEHEVNGRVLPDQLGVDRIHEEGHVVGDDVHHAAVGFFNNRDVGSPGLTDRRDPAVRLCT